MQDASRFADRAAAEIDGLHRLLQAWFRGEGGDDPAPVLQRFDEGFLMITPAGRLLPFAAFAAGFPALRGTRPGLVMEITEVAVRHESAGSALVTYRERQVTPGAANDRASTALLLDRRDRAVPVWRHLSETMITG
jgi:hypothetical protein